MRNLLIIAGLDPSGGAGILADSRVAAHHGLRSVGVVTGLTEQDTRGVRNANVVATEIVLHQLRTLLSDVEIAAVKIGMLGSEAIAGAVAEALDLTAAPVVWDPVLLPTRGRVALYQGSQARAVQLLTPHVTVATPNLHEAAALTGGEAIDDVEGMEAAAKALRGGGMSAVLVTGGHLSATYDGDVRRATEAIDVLAYEGGVERLAGDWIDTGGPVHGTGCALSTALACALARGASLVDAARAAKDFVGSKLREPAAAGRGMKSIV